MSFSTKKMVVAIIIVAVLFVLFLGYAFNNIQKVELDIKVLDGEAVDKGLQAAANEIIDRYYVEYVDKISLKDIDMDILLVDHQAESSCIIKEENVYAVDYNKLDKSIVYCNSFVALSDKRKVLIINCDEILGDAAARAISSAYHYKYATTSNLSPETVECFQTPTQDEKTSFYKYAMIESAKEAFFEDKKLYEFYYFYDQWTYHEGMNKYQEVINYDNYDGFKAFVYAKVMADLDDSFTISGYIDSFTNEYGIYSKDDECTVMGMLWCMLMEKQGNNVICSEDRVTDMYKMLLQGTPIGHTDDSELESYYHQKFVEYTEHIDEIIKVHEDDINNIDAVIPIVTAEMYNGTIKIEDNQYIYIDYTARDSDNNLLQCDYVTVEISPYIMKYYFQ